MNILLIFFAIPLAVIVLSIALQKILKCPLLVAAIIFSILLIVALTAFEATFLIAVIIYTIISFVTALLVEVIGRIGKKLENCHTQNTRPTGNVIANNGGGCLTSGSVTVSCDNNIPAPTNVNFEGCVTPTSRNSGKVCGCYQRR